MKIYLKFFRVLFFDRCSAFTLYLLKLRSSMVIQTQENFIKVLLKKNLPNNNRITEPSFVSQ